MALFLFSCGGKQGTDTVNSEVGKDAPKTNEEIQEELYQEVIAGHDVVMPMTNKVVKLRRKLQKYVKANPDLEEGLVKEIESLTTQMEAAEEGMMEWMATINPGYEAAKNTGKHEAVITYLEGERAKMEAVKKDTKTALNDAKKFFSELEAQ